MKLTIPENISSITPYPPGKPQDELEREYGVTHSIKLASNENPWGPPPTAVQAIQEALCNLHRYPDGSSYYLTQAIAAYHGLEPGEVVLGNGSNEVIEFLVKAFVREGDEVITSHPSFLMYQKIVQVRGGKNIVLPLHNLQHNLKAIVDNISARTRLIFIDNPNNPTGTAIAPVDLYRLLSSVPESVIVVLDEAYVDFMDSDLQVDVYSLIRNNLGRCPVVSLRTFSKAYGLPGLRIGYGLMAPKVANCLHKVRQPFNINSLAQVGALAALQDRTYYQAIIQRNKAGRALLQAGVEKLGCTAYPSQTNFILIDVHVDADTLYNAMLYEGVIIRSMRAYGYSSCIRVTVGTGEENVRFLAALAGCLTNIHG